MTTSRKIPTDWIKNLDSDKAKEDFESLLRNSSRTLRRLKDLCDEYESSIDNGQLSVKLFEEYNWALRQAYMNGQKQAYRKVKDLVTFIER